MRLAGIATIDSANAFLPGFLDAHNERFASEPASSQDAHRPMDDIDFRQILCRHEQRVVTKNLMFQIDDDFFALVDAYSRRHLTTGSRVELQLHPHGTMSAYHGTHLLDARSAGKRLRIAPIVGSKDLNGHLDRRIPNPKKAHTPSGSHPWRTPF